MKENLLQTIKENAHKIQEILEKIKLKEKSFLAYEDFYSIIEISEGMVLMALSQNLSQNPQEQLEVQAQSLQAQRQTLNELLELMNKENR